MESKKKPSVPFIDICAYVECSNNRQEVSLYCFPKKGNPLCDEWLSRVCNPALKHYSSSTLRRMGVCEEHFTPESFKPPLRSYPNGRKKLKRNAIPEPSDHLVEMWKQKLKEFMAAKQKKRDHNIEENEKTKKENGREEQEQQQHPQETRKEQQQRRKEPGKEEQQQQQKKLEIEEQQQQRKEPGKEEQQQQRIKLEIEEQQQQRIKLEIEQQQQRKKLGIEEQQQQRKETGKEQQQQRKKSWIEEQQQQQQETREEEWQETRPVVEEQEIEIEMQVNKPTRVYTKQSFSFSDDEDDGMEWAEDEPAPNYVALGESSLKKSPSEMKLERENVKLKTENKYLKIQLKYLKRRLQRSLISRDRLSNELRKISK